MRPCNEYLVLYVSGPSKLNIWSHRLGPIIAHIVIENKAQVTLRVLSLLSHESSPVRVRAILLLNKVLVDDLAVGVT